MLVGAGAAILQVAGNPIMRDVSDPGKYARNLSLAQFVKAIGSLSGPMIPVIAASAFGADWKVIFPIYAVALLITIAAIARLHVDEKQAANTRPPRSVPAWLVEERLRAGDGAGDLLVRRREVSVSAGIPLYLKERFDIDINKVGLLGTGLFFTALTIGRFSGGVILNWMSPRKAFIADLPAVDRSDCSACSFPTSTLAIAQLLPGRPRLRQHLPAGLLDRGGQHAGTHQ